MSQTTPQTIVVTFGTGLTHQRYSVERDAAGTVRLAYGRPPRTRVVPTDVEDRLAAAVFTLLLAADAVPTALPELPPDGGAEAR